MLQAADALRDAAQNQSGGAGLTAGIGAGMGLGNIIGQSLQGMTGQQQQQLAQPAGGAAAPQAGAMPAVMTPSEAGAVLRVSEEDVLEAIKAGEKAVETAKGSTKEAMQKALDKVKQDAAKK